MKLLGIEKHRLGKCVYFLGIKVYEVIRYWNTEKVYVFGVRIIKRKLSSQAAILEATQKILTLSENYTDMQETQRYVLCFDYLNSPFAEAIDAWTFFQYLQKRRVPSKYALRRDNPLFEKLNRAGKLQDVLPVSSELELLTAYPDIIAQSRIIICSYGFDLGDVFKSYSFSKFIFIEHGVTFLKDWAIKHYSSSQFDGMLVPTRLTKSVYDRNGFDYKACVPYCCGMPRWDKLRLADYEKRECKKIFIFFTWRVSFELDKSLTKVYMSRIRSFVNKIRAFFSVGSTVQLFVSLHHALYERDFRFKGHESFTEINFVPMSEVSEMVREADLCITDFSSIAFDFMYRNIPVIFYNFDTDINYPHEKDQVKECADKIEHSLYNCCRDEDSAVAMVLHYAERNFELESEYIAKNNSIFWSRKGNCERLWQLINEQIENENEG